jgi:hypothetical protein
MAKRTCDVADCDRTHYGRGFCKRHYDRWKARGGEPVTRPAPLADRLWSKVVITPGCWLFTGAKVTGYGVLSRGPAGAGRIQAHRAAWELLVGPIPEGLQIDHLCRVRNCVNPDHLEPVTPRENFLRGEGVSGKNARKTHCPQGHPYDEQNTYRTPTGGRQCLTCRRQHSANRRR